MPYLQLSLAQPVAAEIRHFLARHLTGLLAELLGKRADVTAVRIDTVQADSWYIAGEAIATSHPPYHLDLYITAGSNNAAEKAAFLDAAHRLISDCFGPPAAASYIALHELPGESWGYAGLSQAARKAADGEQGQAWTP